MDVVAVQKAARKAVESVRSNGGPHFLEFRTYRFRAHSMFDPELYRSKEEVQEWKERDPIDVLRERLEAEGSLTAEALDAMEARVAEEVEAAVEFAEAGTWEPIEELTRFVYSEVAAR
jgi:pyruvate dehydrogenase E1 component alpha subunit